MPWVQGVSCVIVMQYVIEIIAMRSVRIIIV